MWEIIVTFKYLKVLLNNMIFKSTIIEIAGTKYARIPKPLAEDQDINVGKCKVEESRPNGIKITFD